MRKSLVLLAAIACAGCSGLENAAENDPQAALSDVDRDAALERLAVARRVWETFELYLRQGRLDPLDDQLRIWSLRIAAASVESGTAAATAYEEHLAHMQQKFQDIEDLSERGRFSMVDVENARYDVLEAKQLLAEAKKQEGAD